MNLELFERIEVRNPEDPDDWPTPDALFNPLDEEFHFTLDVAASDRNAKCDRYFTRERSAFTEHWDGVVWMNPPYTDGRALYDWVSKAHRSAKTRRATVVCLLPSKTDTLWWHEFCIGNEIRWIKGRVRFAGKFRASFPVCIVIFRPAGT